VRFLDRLTQPATAPDSLKVLAMRETIAQSALSAIALHRDPAADAVLERIAADRSDPLRSRALARLGSSRGARGLTVLRQMLTSETTPEGRRQLASAIGASREPGAVDALRGLLKDSDAKVRAEAVARFAAAGGPAVVNDVVARIQQDDSPDVKRRATQAIANWPRGEGIAALLQLARSSTDAGVRKEAVSALSRSTDPRALAYMEELIKR
jgi:HEAT repeat protein